MIPLEYYQALAKRIYFIDGVPYWNQKSPLPRLWDKVAGEISDPGYRRICISINKKRKSISAHRLHWYMEFGEVPKQLDHIKGVKIDNRIEELRPSTQSQNMRNVKKIRGRSKYRGVTLNDNGRWRSRIKDYGKSIHLGYFDDEIEAAKAYDTALIKYGWDNFGHLNFPQK